MSNIVHVHDIIRAAQEEIEAEEFRRRVDKEKARLLAHRPWWQRLFPWVIHIERRT